MENNERPQLTADLEGNYLIDKESAGEKAIGLFYAPSGGSVHKVAKRIKQKIKDRKVDMLYIRDVKPEDFLNYRNIILVSSTSGKDAWNNDLIEEKGGILIGKTETDGYTYTLSRSIQDNLFMGLPLDEDNEANQTDARIEKWLSLVLPEMES